MTDKKFPPEVKIIYFPLEDFLTSSSEIPTGGGITLPDEDF